MKFIWIAIVLIFVQNLNAVRSNDSEESGKVDSNDAKLAAAPAEVSSDKTLNKSRKFVVTIKPPNNTPFVLPKRSEKKPFMPKFQLKNGAQTNNIGVFPSSTTKRPNLMQIKKFTSKPHIVDGTRTLLERYNFNKERTPSKFNKPRAEEKAEKKNEKKDSETPADRFQNFKNIDNSDEDDSEEVKPAVVVPKRRFMKTAASNKVKTVVPKPITNTVKIAASNKVKTAVPKPIANTVMQSKIKDLLRNKTNVPRMEMKRIVPIVIQKTRKPVSFDNKYRRTTAKTLLNEDEKKPETNVESVSKKNLEDSAEKADEKEFSIEKNQKDESQAPVSLGEKEVVISVPTNGESPDSRPKRSINIIEEEQRVPTKSSYVRYNARDLSLTNVYYNNINA